MMADRTARIQAQLDEAATAKAEADEAAASIRARPRATSTPSASGCWPRPTRRPRACSCDGRARLDQEVAELLAKAESEIESVQGRLQSEVQAEVARAGRPRHRARWWADSLDDELQQQLVEDFIARVGAAS